jgi:ADP-dependent NAD(P)H-hydrate dehydratase
MDQQQPLDGVTLPRLPARPVDAHKGNFGTALLIGGSRTMSGAISLAALAALRGGAGKVRVACPEACHAIVAGFDPCYMVVPLPGDAAGLLARGSLEKLIALCDEATCIGLGPGLGQSDDVNQIVAALYRSVKQPMVVDADGLNALAKVRSALGTAAGPRILTPHPGEFGRLTGRQHLSPAARGSAAQQFAKEVNGVVVLKGHQSIITDGARVYANATGNPGMATGGTGDVLTGIITALVCQSLAPLDAARLGAHVHGLAGDLSVKARGPVGITALDLVGQLSAALEAVIG